MLNDLEKMKELHKIYYDLEDCSFLGYSRIVGSFYQN